MEYVQLAGTTRRISRITIGTEPLGGTDWGSVDIAAVERGIQRAVELGINVFDTADVYGLGLAEERLSKALGAQRHEVCIISKFGVNWEPAEPGKRAKTYFDSRPQRVVEALEASLRRLRIESIPLYLVHWPDPRTPIEDTFDMLRRCQAAGKIQCLGVSNFSAEQIRTAHRLAPLTAVQISYNLLDRRAEQAIIPVCDELGISVFCYGALAQGFLTGKYQPGTQFATDDRRFRLPHFSQSQLNDNLWLIERLQTIAQSRGKFSAQVAIRWILENPSVASAITGIKSAEQVESNAGALDWSLNEQEKLNLVNK